MKTIKQIFENLLHLLFSVIQRLFLKELYFVVARLLLSISLYLKVTIKAVSYC